jgi:hypothetical protein
MVQQQGSTNLKKNRIEPTRQDKIKTKHKDKTGESRAIPAETEYKGMIGHEIDKTTAS